MNWRRVARLIRLEAPLAHIGNGATAPEFSFPALDGKKYSLTTLLQRGPVLLAFFKISCPVCQFTFPFLQRIAERFAGKGASVIAISQDDARDTKEFNQEYGIKFPTLIDASGYPVSNAYGLSNVPTIFLIEPSGKVKIECTGFDKEALEKMAGELALHDKLAATPLFRPDEVVPAYKPG
jgi:peroxiredoxin